jgi:anti-sigma factor RsiW
MHPTIEEILAVRDGEAPPGVAHHVASCRDCGEELERLRAVRDALRALPDACPPVDLWPATRQRIEATRTVAKWWIAAAAALLMVAAGGAALLLNHSRGGDGMISNQPVQQAGAGAAQENPVAPWNEPPLPASDPEVARLIRNSQQLEFLLGHMDERPVVVSGRAALAEMGIQERLSLVDARLETIQPGVSDRAERVGLWQERVRLLGTLAQVKGGKKKSAEI